ncbi:carboxypeptidase-like regulatory domain-containing protein [Patescibacteria group bacterium]|nr:carboxypeptidase-like regulatory domain-containing protein [Patescibacteria group bacterium]MCG2694865.1 carboxypeptidase-like regulatory domain-containing protein [Candidatus Parcubacteria bacterium]
MFNFKSKKNKGFTLIDGLISIAIITTVFFSVFGAFRMGLMLLSSIKAKAGAIVLAEEQMEFIRSLPYNSVGTLSGIPIGNIPQTEIIDLNGIEYTRRALIQNFDDPKDGEGSDDENGITSDYKKVKIELSWNNGSDLIFVVSDIVPKGIETISGGGTLSLTVFNAFGAPIQGANILIENDDLAIPVSVNSFTNLNGKVVFPGSPSNNNYKITVTKGGYSTAQTYEVAGENVSPSPRNLSVIEGDLTEAGFSIDLLSSKIVKTFLAISEKVWEDLFIDMSQISQFGDVEVSSGSLKLLEGKMSGFAYSTEIKPTYLSSWKDFNWDDSTPADTDILYKVYFSSDDINYNLIPDVDLSGNGSGFSSSPVDLSSLSISTYNNLKLYSDLSTSDASTTPEVLDWEVSYLKGPVPLANIDFHMEGNKIIGNDTDGDPIKKYSQNLQTNVSGELGINSLEWDNYNISIDNISLGYDILHICPWQPNSLAPNDSETVDMILSPHTANSILVYVSDQAGNFLPNASVRLYNGVGYDSSKNSDSCGQVFFNSISLGSYSLDISLGGFVSLTVPGVSVSGNINQEVVLESI